nr:MAG TPA: hypothetical protein [Caudoviricetes sp.]
MCVALRCTMNHCRTVYIPNDVPLTIRSNGKIYHLVVLRSRR